MTLSQLTALWLRLIAIATPHLGSKMVLSSFFTRLASRHLSAVFKNQCFAIKDHVQSISHRLWRCPKEDCPMLCGAVASVRLAGAFHQVASDSTDSTLD